MITKSIVKLIDEALIPAVVIIVGKMAGLLLTASFFRFPFTVESRSFLAILPTVHFQQVGDYIVAENYSNLAMFTLITIGATIVLLRAHFFHESHIHPRLHARLVTLNLESLIAPSYHLYHQAFIWLTFLWLTVGFLILSSVLNVTYPQISIIATIIAANFSWILAVDVEKEIEISRASI